MAIIYTIEIQDGEREYTEWDYMDHHYEDYENGNLTDKDLLYDFFGTELEDTDRVAYRRAHTEEYWIGDVTAYIGKVSSITKEHLELVKEYV
tara:strand:- start:827 stop:1102 length:276 start_codon:yes stop_codon:yes gene_type:complete